MRDEILEWNFRKCLSPSLHKLSNGYKINLKTILWILLKTAWNLLSSEYTYLYTHEHYWKCLIHKTIPDSLLFYSLWSIKPIFCNQFCLKIVVNYTNFKTISKRFWNFLISLPTWCNNKGINGEKTFLWDLNLFFV